HTVRSEAEGKCNLAQLVVRDSWPSLSSLKITDAFPPTWPTRVIRFRSSESLRNQSNNMRVCACLPCVVVSPKVADCTPASDAVKPTANNCARNFFQRESRRQNLSRNLQHAALTRTKIFFSAAHAPWKKCLNDCSPQKISRAFHRIAHNN